MKTAFKLCLFVFGAIPVIGHAQTATAPAPTPYIIVHREANERTWQRTVYEVSPSGQTIPHVQSYKELATGLCYQPPGQNGKWLDSDEKVTILPDGSAAATNGRHQAYFPANIANGAIKLVTPGGLQLQSQPIGLSYDDGTNTVLIAELTNSVGELISSNQVVYPNAFAGINADLVYTYRKSGFEQDVVFRAQPPAPEEFGFDSAVTKLQLVTEFFNPPYPLQSTGPVNPQDGLQDTTLAFGSMRMIPGKAFLTGGTNRKSRSNQNGVYKSWIFAGGRNLLIEQLPFQKVSQELGTLPSSNSVSSADSILRKVSSKRLLPPTRLAQATTDSIQLAKAEFDEKQGLVLDYATVDSAATNFTFQGDTTYYVSGLLYLYGTNVLEGGSVLKMSFNGEIEIDENGSIDCQTGPYRPCVFTSWNDNSIGQNISGSSGTPYFADISEYLYCLATNNITLHDLRFCYSEFAAVQWGNPEPHAVLTIRDCQFENVARGVQAYDVELYNDLFGDTADEISSVANEGMSQVFAMNSLTAENVTADSGYAFIGDFFGVPALTNCLITGEPMYSPGVPAPVPLSSGVFWLPSPSTPVYQTVGGGNYYLATDSPYRGAGTTNIDQSLLADIARKTTWPPVVYEATNVSSLGILGPVAPRDISSAPDIGYHYDCLDYVFGGCDLYSKLTFTTGTTVGWFEENNGADPYGQPYGISLNAGASLSFNGNATFPCIFARYPMVQEAENGNWTGNGWMGALMFNGGSPEPQLSAGFTKITSDDWSGGIFRDDWASGAGAFRNCEFYNFSIATYYMTSLTFTNCLFSRLNQSFWTSPNLTFENCTFYNGGMDLDRSSPVTWLIENCSFDGTAFNWNDIYNGTSYTTIDYNAYNTNNLSWQTYPLNPPYYGTNEVVGPDDLMTTNYDWQTSWFGDFYLPPDSPLFQKGSPVANLLGLYQFTTQTNQAIDGNNPVTIGYHYVATDQNGNPIDSNGDGIPDYIEDANGNGPGDLGLSVIISQPRNGSTLP